MEEKNLIPLKYDVETCGISVERNKKRQAEKTKRIFIRALIILFLIGIIFGAIKLFPLSKDFFSNLGKTPEKVPAVNDDTSSDSSSKENNVL